MSTITTERQALLNAILHAPDDDAPRLIFADWLDENAGEADCEACDGRGYPHCSRCSGEGCSVYSVANHGTCETDKKCPKCNGTGLVSNGFAEQADFIRVQCEIARIPTDFTDEAIHGGSRHDEYLRFMKLDCRWCELEYRERQIFASRPPHQSERHWPDLWCQIDNVSHVLCYGEPDKGDKRPTHHLYRLGTYAHFPCRIFRGFVDSIQMRFDEWIDHGPKIVRHHPLSRVEITDRHAPSGLWFANRDQNTVENPVDSNWLPWKIAVHLQNLTPSVQFEYPRFIRHGWQFNNAEQTTEAISFACLMMARLENETAVKS